VILPARRWIPEKIDSGAPRAKRQRDTYQWTSLSYSAESLSRHNA
jgi:hypothetical protein